MHACADGQDVGIVVLARKLRRLDVPRQRSPYSFHLVGRDLFSVTRSPQYDAEAARVGHDGARRRQAERRVVVLGVVLMWSMVDDIVTSLRQRSNEVLLELEPCVVRAEVHSHQGWSPRLTSFHASGNRPAAAKTLKVSVTTNG